MTQDHAKTAIPMSSIRSRLFAAATIVWRALIGGGLDDYRPELHYMRGPGPKWHAKLARAARQG